MEFTPLELLQGSLTFAFVVISTILGILIMTKYRKNKARVFLLVGISWILIVSPYWSDAVNFVLGLSTGTLLKNVSYFFLANAFIPVVHITWIMAFADLVYKSKEKIIVPIFAIEATIFEIYFLYSLITDPRLVGTQFAPFYVEWEIFIVLYLILSIAIFLITGLIFAGKSIKSENHEVRIKGKFLVFGFIFFAIGTTIDAIGILTPFTLVLARFFVILGAIMFYIGFILPGFIRKIFIKSDLV